MNTLQIFGLQFLWSLLLYALLAKWFVAPRLAPLPLPDALIPLFFLHAFRHVGMVFLVPAIVAPELAPAFARPAAYGDLLAAALALVTLVALRVRSPVALPVAWAANIWGTLDLLYAFYEGIHHDVSPWLGSGWYIPTIVVPALYVTHFMIFVMLIKRGR